MGFLILYIFKLILANHMKKNFALLLLFFSLFFLAQPTATWAIGQITEPINIENALRGQEIVSKITVLNSEKQQNVIGLVAEGSIANWTKFYQASDKEFANPITEITVPAGDYADVGVLFTIPADTANGSYTGELSVVYNPTQASSEQETASTVAQKISRSVTIVVSDQEVILLDASVIPNKFDYAPNEPLSLRIIYDNKSNITLTPSIQIKIKKDEKTVYNVIYPYPENEPAVRSMSLYEIPALSIPTADLGQGSFVAELTFLKGDKNILEKTFSFSIGNQGLVKGAMLTNLKNHRTLIGLAVLIILIFIILTLTKKKARRSDVTN